MSPSLTVSEINGDCSRKSQFFHLRVFNGPLKGFPLEFGIDARGKKLE